MSNFLLHWLLSISNIILWRTTFSHDYPSLLDIEVENSKRIRKVSKGQNQKTTAAATQ